MSLRLRPHVGFVRKLLAMRKILRDYMEYWLRFYSVSGDRWGPVMEAVEHLVNEFDKAVGPQVKKSWKEMRFPLHKDD